MLSQRRRGSFNIVMAWASLAVIFVNIWFYDRLGLHAPGLECAETKVTPKTWANRHDVVHVVFSRFMQTQPNLTQLGRARLELLKSVTLPNLMHQTTSEFLWIIRTDPKLEITLLNELKQEIEKMPNAVLILSNRAFSEIRKDVKDVTPETVVAGSYDLVMSYHWAAQHKVVLETRIDADDALSATFIEDLQTAVSERSHSLINPSSWIVWCAFKSIEWQFFNPWDKKSKEGVIVPATSAWCVTPGLTVAFYPQAGRADLPTNNHAKLAKMITRCNTTVKVNCIEELPTTSTFRSRTPTSEGMRNVFSADTENQNVSRSDPRILFHNEYWNGLKHRFGIDADRLVTARAKLLDNLSAVVSDAQSHLSNCTSLAKFCSKERKEQLEKLLAKSGKKESY